MKWSPRTKNSAGVGESDVCVSERGEGPDLGERQTGRVGNVGAEIAEEPVLKAIDPAVDGQRLAAGPGVPHDRGLADVGHLFDDVEFAEPIGTCGIVGKIQETTLVFLAHILDMAEPVVGEADSFAAEHGADAAAAIVSDDHDVFHAQHIDRVLDHRKTVQVGVDDDIGDVAVDENFAREEADNFVGGHAAIGATDPKVFGILLAREFLEKIRIA